MEQKPLLDNLEAPVAGPVGKPPAKRKSGKELKDQGIARAAEHSGKDWQAAAYRVLYDFVQMRKDGERQFTAEDVREYAHVGVNLPKPPDSRSWGAVMMKGARAGLYTKAGYTEAKDPISHQGPVTLWEACDASVVSRPL